MVIKFIFYRIKNSRRDCNSWRKDFTLEVELSPSYIEENRNNISDDALKKGITIVNIDWKIGYGSGHGSCFFLDGY